MVEMRWVKRTRKEVRHGYWGSYEVVAACDVLQYRFLGPPYCVGDQELRDWSEWIDVPVVDGDGR